MDGCRRRAFLGVLGASVLGMSTSLAQEPSLDDTLKFGLKARRPIEFQFVAEIATLTNNGQLPKDFVLAAFDYSRKRRPHLPLPYFDFVVRRKAEELGIT